MLGAIERADCLRRLFSEPSLLSSLALIPGQYSEIKASPRSCGRSLYEYICEHVAIATTHRLISPRGCWLIFRFRSFMRLDGIASYHNLRQRDLSPPALMSSTIRTLVHPTVLH